MDSCAHSCHSTKERNCPPSSPKQILVLTGYMHVCYCFCPPLQSTTRESVENERLGEGGVVWQFVCFYSYFTVIFLLSTINCVCCISPHNHCSAHELSGVNSTDMITYPDIPDIHWHTLLLPMFLLQNWSAWDKAGKPDHYNFLLFWCVCNKAKKQSSSPKSITFGAMRTVGFKRCRFTLVVIRWVFPSVIQFNSCLAALRFSTMELRCCSSWLKSQPSVLH